MGHVAYCSEIPPKRVVCSNQRILSCCVLNAVNKIVDKMGLGVIFSAQMRLCCVEAQAKSIELDNYLLL